MLALISSNDIIIDIYTYIKINNTVKMQLYSIVNQVVTTVKTSKQNKFILIVDPDSSNAQLKRGTFLHLFTNPHRTNETLFVCDKQVKQGKSSYEVYVNNDLNIETSLGHNINSPNLFHTSF